MLAIDDDVFRFTRSTDWQIIIIRVHFTQNRQQNKMGKQILENIDIRSMATETVLDLKSVLSFEFFWLVNYYSDWNECWLLTVNGIIKCFWLLFPFEWVPIWWVLDWHKNIFFSCAIQLSLFTSLQRISPYHLYV